MPRSARTGTCKGPEATKKPENREGIVGHGVEEEMCRAGRPRECTQEHESWREARLGAAAADGSRGKEISTGILHPTVPSPALIAERIPD